MQIARWGDGLAVRLPDEVVKKLALKEGDEVDIRAAGSRTLDVAPKTDVTALMEKLRSFQGLLPSDFKFDRDEANAR